MDLGYLLNILLRRKWLILSVALLAAVVTFLLVGTLPPTYKADAVIETGIIKYKGLTLSKEGTYVQEFLVESAFNNLLDQMHSRRSVRMLTDTLLRHDMVELDRGEYGEPFRLPDLEEAELTADDFDVFRTVLTSQHHRDTTGTVRVERVNNLRQSDLAKAFGYDYKTMLEDLSIVRKGDTDNIEVSFSSESPELSYFAVQEFLRRFLKYYEEEFNAEGNERVRFYRSELVNKKRELDGKTREIESLRQRNGLVDVDVQGKSVVEQIKELEVELETQRSSIPALRRDLEKTQSLLVRYGSDNGGEYQSVTYLNERISTLRQQQGEMVEQYYDGGAQDEKLKERMKAVSDEIQSLVQQLASARQEGRKAGVRGKSERIEKLFERQLEQEADLNTAIAAADGLQREIASLRGRKGGLTRDDGTLRRLEREREVLEKAYLQLEDQLRDAQVKLRSTPNPLTVVEPAQLPDEPESSKRMLLTAFSGIGGGTLSVLAVLLMAFFDRTMQTPGQLRSYTKLPLAGAINRLRARELDLATLFQQYQPKGGVELFKEGVRRLRNVLETSGGKSFLFVSPKAGEGKSFLILMLAHSLSLSDKRVLIVDTNFKHNTLSGYAKDGQFEVRDVRDTGKRRWFGGSKEAEKQAFGALELHNVTIMGNRGGAQSPNEILVGKNFGQLVENFKRQYDYIFLEAATMNDYSDARELLPFADKVVGVVNAENELGPKDNDSLDFLRGLGDRYLGTVLNMADARNL